MSVDTNAVTRGQLSERVLDFCKTLQRLVVEAKQYDALPADFWDPIKAFIAVDDFHRCSQDYPTIVTPRMDEAKSNGYDSTPMMTDVLDWTEWSTVIGKWALSPSLWEYTVMRIAEFTIPGLPGAVYVEMEERGGFSGQLKDIHWSNTIQLFEFN